MTATARVRQILSVFRGRERRAETPATLDAAEQARLAREYLRTHPPEAPPVSGCCDRADQA